MTEVSGGETGSIVRDILSVRAAGSGIVSNVGDGRGDGRGGVVLSRRFFSGMSFRSTRRFSGGKIYLRW